MKKGRWPGRAYRGLRPDRNPLRRRMDRVEVFIFGGLLVAAATAAPLTAVGASHWAYTGALRAAQVEQATGRQVTAVLLGAPVTTIGGYSVTSMLPAPARWTAPGGAPLTGQILVPPGSSKGQAFTIWTDATGAVASPPMTRAQAADQGTFAAVMAIIVTLVTCITAAGITRALTNRRRLRAWTADWAVTAPMWTRQRW